MEKRTNRSQNYQHLLVETVYSNDMMEFFCNEDSISARLNPFEYNEDIMDLEERLRVEFWRIVEDNLTKRRKEVIHLRSRGFTQMEVAKMLNVNQSSITKSLNGNVDYKNAKNGGQKQSYGGSAKKLTKLINEDEKVIAILAQINELRNEKW